MLLKSSRSADAFLALAVLLIAAALRFYNLGGTSLWLDEAVYANNSVGDFTQLLANTRNNNSSPVILPFLYWLFGDGIRTPFRIRLMPALFGTATVFVLLMFTRVGLSRRAVFMAAIWLTLSPAHITYSQEVREYSLAALMSSLLIYGFARGLRTDRAGRMPWLLLATCFVAPSASYGNIFLVAVLLFVYFAAKIVRRDFSPLEFAALGGTALAAVVLAYASTAKYQMGIGQSAYLADGYAPHEILALSKWLLKSLASYLNFTLGGILPALLGASAAVYLMYSTSKHRIMTTLEGQLVVSAVLLVVLGIALSLAGAYPFKGVRQHLFTAPLLVLAAAVSVDFAFTRWAGRTAPGRAAKTALLAAAFALMWVPTLLKVPAVYREQQDIRAAVGRIDSSADDSDVFVYYGAAPAALFHYPQRQFHRSRTGRGQVSAMYDELRAMPHCNVYVVFSHIFKDEDTQLLDLARLNALTVEKDEKFPGARLVKIDKCSRRSG